jgi:hypothetical protein
MPQAAELLRKSRISRPLAFLKLEKMRPAADFADGIGDVESHDR